MVRAKAREPGPMDGRADGVAARQSLSSRAGVRRCVAVGLALVMVSGMTGCGGGDAGGTPSVPGGSSVTPSVTPTRTPSEDPLFTEAKAVHLKYVEEMVVFEKRGGGSPLPQSMSSLIDGEYEAAVMSAYKEFKAKGLRASPGSTWKRTSTWRIKAENGHAIGLGACVDLRGVTYRKGDSSGTSRGPWRRDELMFDVRSNSVAITEGSSRKVDSCAP